VATSDFNSLKDSTLPEMVSVKLKEGAEVPIGIILDSVSDIVSIFTKLNDSLLFHNYYTKLIVNFIMSVGIILSLYYGYTKIT